MDRALQLALNIDKSFNCYGFEFRNDEMSKALTIYGYESLTSSPVNLTEDLIYGGHSTGYSLPLTQFYIRKDSFNDFVDSSNSYFVSPLHRAYKFYGERKFNAMYSIIHPTNYYGVISANLERDSMSIDVQYSNTITGDGMASSWGGLCHVSDISEYNEKCRPFKN